MSLRFAILPRQILTLNHCINTGQIYLHQNVNKPIPKLEIKKEAVLLRQLLLLCSFFQSQVIGKSFFTFNRDQVMQTEVSNKNQNWSHIAFECGIRTYGLFPLLNYLFFLCSPAIDPFFMLVYHKKYFFFIIIFSSYLVF